MIYLLLFFLQTVMIEFFFYPIFFHLFFVLLDQFTFLNKLEWKFFNFFLFFSELFIIII